jgi:DHA2 family methylenomycin A resistance protein-like MFS transporter
MNRRITGTVLAASLGFGLVQLDASIVNVALASLGREFHIGTALVAWIVDAYAIAFACTLLAGGALGDRIGAKRAFIGGFAVFGLASIGCTFAPSIGFLIGMRVLQGIGASTLVPCSLALISHAVGDDAKLRAKAISVWTAVASGSLAAGPVVGGALIATLGWRAIFAINIPLCIAAVWLTLKLTEETEPRPGRFDLAGQVLSVVTLLAATTGIIEGGALGLGSTIVQIACVVTVIGAAGFVVAESRISDPMVPLGFFRSRTFSAAVGVGLAINAGLYGTLFMLALYLQHSQGYTPLEVGFAFIPLAIVLATSNVIAGPVMSRFGLRIPMIVGLGIALIGFSFLFLYAAHTPYWELLPAILIIPTGIGMAVPSMTSALLGEIPKERSGIASGVLNTVRQAAGALGVAVAAALVAHYGDVLGMRYATVLWVAAFAAAIAAAFAGIARRAGRQPA